MTNRLGSLFVILTSLGLGHAQGQVPSRAAVPTRPFQSPSVTEVLSPAKLPETSMSMLAAAPTPQLDGATSSTLGVTPSPPVPPPPLPPQSPNTSPNTSLNLTESSNSARANTAAANGVASQDDTVIRLTVGRGRVLSVPSPIVNQGDVAVIAVGDPSVADFEVLPNPRLLRLVGKRPGLTDLTVVTSDDQTLVYELHVQYDLSLLEARLRQSFPTALVKITQLGNHLILEGQARDSRQSSLIESAVQAFVDSTNAVNSLRGRATASTSQGLTPEDFGVDQGDPEADDAMSATSTGEFLLRSLPESTPRAQTSPTSAGQIINLISLPGVQQVMLQVRIAELNRTALREIGADTYFEWGPGNIMGTNIAGSTVPILQTERGGIGPELGANSTAFGIFPSTRMNIILRALRENAVLRVLAEPNLVALSGHEASFLAGGEFPVPVAQGGSLGAGNITVQYKEFGVQLNFVPYIMDDDVIRLEVRPEVSSIDERLGTTLVVGGEPTPGINTRRVHTTVQIREGETLALAGLLQVNLAANTSRIPGLGDLPYIGPLFSNTSHSKQEKELLVLVTPFLVSPMNSCEVPPLPGAEIQDPNDLEFYLLNRIEGRTGENFRSTTSWDDPLHLVRRMKLEREHMYGPVGFSAYPGSVIESR